MPKFFADPNDIKDNRVILRGEDAAHIARALRGKAGDVHIIGDGRGRDYECEILEVGRDKASVTFSILAGLPAENEPGVKITLYQALPKLDKMDAVIQKCVELGAAKIVPVVTDNTVVRPDGGGERRKPERWRKIAEAAAKQSMRGIVPEITAVTTLKEAVLGGGGGGDGALGGASSEDGALGGASGGGITLFGPAPPEELRFAPYENEKAVSVKSLLSRGVRRSAGFFIGPEGGFSEAEVRLFRENGIETVSLGPRILRTETAGMTTLAMILYEWEL